MNRRHVRTVLQAGSSLLWLALASPVTAQEPYVESSRLDSEEAESRFVEPLETDRDSFTPAVTVIGPGRVLVETSYSFLENRVAPESHSFPELLTRVGLTERTELRLGWNYEAGGGGSVSGAEVGEDPESASLKTEAALLYGFKTTVNEQDSWLPASVVILQATTPTAGVETDTQFVAAYGIGWKLLDDWKLDAALRYGTDSEAGDHFENWAPSIVLRVPLHERWNVHAEYFGIFTRDKAKEGNVQYFSPGIHYLLTPDCEIGIRTGWGLTDDAARFFTNVGCGLRF